MGVSMNWGSDDAAPEKKAAPAQPSNPYLQEFPLNLAQANSPDDEPEAPSAPASDDSFVSSRMNRWGSLRKHNMAALRARAAQKEEMAMVQEKKQGKKPDARKESSGVNPYIVDLA